MGNDDLWLAGLSSAFAGLGLLGALWRKKKKKKNASFVTQDTRTFGKKIRDILRFQNKAWQDVLNELEENLLTSDVGVVTTQYLLDDIRQNVDNPEEAYETLKQKITALLTPTTSFMTQQEKRPYVIYMVGVNGVGKTTTLGKLAHYLKQKGLTSLLVAGDTFRAAACEQLKIWADRNDVSFVGGEANADPSSVIVDGLRSAKAKGVDVVLVDTAGRLQTKANLMAELSKMIRVCQKELGYAPQDVLLVLDAVTGQNGLNQAKVFLESATLSGVVLTKYDATAKGGIILAIAKEMKLPIRFVGLGEKIADLKEFSPQEFASRLLGE